MKAIEVTSVANGSGPAPKEWREIPEIKAVYPKRKNCEKSLQTWTYKKIKFAQWFISRVGGCWEPEGPVFIIK
jgi:hypothetical protein